MDKVTAAKVFVDVAHTGSFTATSERLNMSRPMVTRYIEAMEAWLDARLLHRTTRKVSLTNIGAQCLDDVEQWVDAGDRMVSLIKPSNELSGSVRIATSMSFGHSRLMAAVSTFMNLHPKVAIDIDLQDSEADLVKSRIDLAIRIASAPDPSLTGKPIAKCHSALVASSDYLNQNSIIDNPEDLTRHQCLGYNHFERHVWHLVQGKKRESIEVNCRLTANEATALMQAAVHGAGIAMQPTYLVNPLIESGKLIQVLGNWQPLDLDIYVLYPSRKHLSPTVRALIDFFDDYFKENSWDVGC
ncbi:LysR family transcriptional regulator [Vibrio algarum]|uniref:LysR family transcriptional regulator n=1 Tax=Vibrio algarum TaxID=3020714 RepID=A0ABT4YTQ4_9VIBR|nr:LysR family transcriptional regulator [Vibrio sp. KJ40-1]MDB1124944.1 LysR family transcriptional regulator [Vibrio sp. KJ40-1]